MTRELELIAGASLADTRPGPVRAAAGAGPKHAVAHRECLNCGALLHGRFCAACGQAADDHHRSILALVWEWVQDLTHLDGRLAKTLPPLFFAPGRLARDHFEGRRQRHVPPLRLFFVSLLVFMLVLEGAMHGGAGRPAKGTGAATLGTTTQVRTSDGSTVSVTTPSAAQISAWTGGRVSAEEIAARARRTDAFGAPREVTAAPAPGGAAKGAKADRGDPVGDWFRDRVPKAQSNPEYFKTVAFEWAHRLAILLLPIFASLLTLLYCYRRRFYVYDHLVVSMHFLSFTFLISAVAYVLPHGFRRWGVLAALVWTPVNLFMTLRGAYGSGVPGAGLKTVVLWTASVTLFGLLIVGILLLALGQL